MNKIGKITRIQCVCGRRYNKTTGEWYGATKEQVELDKRLSEQGHLQVKIEMCEKCRKGRGL